MDDVRQSSEDTCWKWVVESWNELSPAVIVKSFKKCSISNAMDGTEDDVLWEEESTEQPPPLDEENAADPYDDAIPTNEWE